MRHTLRHGRETAAVALAAGALLAAGATSARADTLYPQPSRGGATFDSDADGFSEVHACNLLNGPLTQPVPLCTITQGFDSTDGNDVTDKNPTNSGAQNGSLASSLTGPATVTQSLGLVLSANGTLASPQFKIAAGTDATKMTLPATFSMNRKADINGLLAALLNGGVQNTVTLVDDTTPGRTPLVSQQLNAAQPWTAIKGPAGLQVKVGDTYHLEITNSFGALLISAFPQQALKFDTIRLAVQDGSPDPDVARITTLPASAVGRTSAQLNSTIYPGGHPTYSGYEIGTASTGPFTVFPTDAATLAPLAGSRFADRTPNPFVDTQLDANTPLQPGTTYWYQAIAFKDAAHTVRAATGAPVSFKTLTDGTNGTNGSNGSNGTNGSNGATGTTGSTGGTGSTGATGATGVGLPGKTGATGAKGASGVTESTVKSGSSKSLLNINTNVVTVGTKGRRYRQVRLPIFCKKKTGRACAGTVKLRTVGKINPASRGKARSKRKVTFITFEYQLAQGKKGIALGTFDIEKLDLAKRVTPIKVDALVQVTDAGGNRQTITRRVTLKTHK